MKRVSIVRTGRSVGTLVFGLAVSALLFAAPAQAQQQGESDMSFGLDETATEPTDATDPAQDTGTDAPAGEGDVIGDLANTGTADTGARDAAPRSEEVAEEIYAVQQIYALRINRVELLPSWTFTVNDQYVSHSAPSIGLNYWFTNVLAIGANFLWYQGLESESDLTFNTRRSTRLAVPITEYQMGAHLNFTYVPLYGKFSVFNELIWQFDAYVLGGVGLMRTRPVPVIDPEIRQFDFDWRVAFNVGIGIRVFITRWLAIFAEIRDYMYLEQLENLEVALGDRRRGATCGDGTPPPCMPGNEQNTTSWFANGVSFTNNVTIHLGATVFLPFDFDYHRPR